MLHLVGGEGAGGSVIALVDVGHIPDLRAAGQSVGVRVVALGQRIIGSVLGVEGHGAVGQHQAIAVQHDVTGGAGQGGDIVAVGGVGEHAVVHGILIVQIHVLVVVAGDLQGGGGAVLQNTIDLDILAGAAVVVAAQDVDVILGGHDALVVEQNHVGQVGGAHLLGHEGGVLVHVGHLGVADGHAVLDILGVGGVIVEGHGVLVNGQLAAAAVVAQGGGAGLVVGAEGIDNASAQVVAGLGLVIGTHNGLDGHHVVVGQGVGDDVALGLTIQIVLLIGISAGAVIVFANKYAGGALSPRTGRGVVRIGGAQEALQLLDAHVLVGIIGGLVDLLAQVLGGGREVQGVSALGAVRQQSGDLGGGVGSERTGHIAGLQDQSVVVDSLLGRLEGRDIAVGIQVEVILGIPLHTAVLGALGHVEGVELLGIALAGDVDKGGLVLGAVDLDPLLLGLVGGVGLHLAGDDLGLGHIVVAAVSTNQDDVALLGAVVQGHVLQVDGTALVVGGDVLVGVGAEGDGLLLLVQAGDDGQILLHPQHILGHAVVIVVDNLQLNAVAVGGKGGLTIILQLQDVVGGVLVLHDAVVDIVLGLVVLQGDAGALQQVLHVGLVGHGGHDGVGLLVQGHAQNLGVGQDGILADVHGDGLAQVLHGGLHIKGSVLLGGGILNHGVAGGGGDDLVAGGQQGLAVHHGLVIVGAVEHSVLIAQHNALHLVHAVHGAQDGAAVVVSNGIAVLVLLDHLHVQGVVDQQSRIVTVQSLSHVLGEAAEDAQTGGQGVGVDRPVGALQALGLGIVASGHQQHLGGLNSGHAGAGVEGAVAAAGDDAGGVAVIDVTLRPVAGDVGQPGGAVLVQGAVVSPLIHDDGDHLRHLCAVHALARRIGTIGLALDDAQRREHGNRILVHDLSAVGEIGVARSAGADNHHADNHDDCQKQAESPFEVSHSDFPPSKF